MRVAELSLVEPMSLVYSVSDDSWFVIVVAQFDVCILYGELKILMIQIRVLECLC